MIRYFQSAYPSRLLMLIVLALGLWFPAIFSSVSEPMVWQTPYADLYTHFVFPGWLGLVLGFLLFLIPALWMNKVGISTTLISKNTYLTALLFLIFAGQSPGLLTLNPFLVTAFLLILFLERVYRLQKHPHPIVIAFDAGLLLGIGVLLFPPLIILFVFIWLSLIAYRVGTWRAYLVSLLGTMTPYLIVLSLRFLMDRPLDPLRDIMGNFSFHPVVLFSGSWFNMAVVALLGILVVVAVFYMISTMGQKKIAFRQHALTTLWAFFLILMLILIFNKNRQVLLLMAGPASLLLAAFLDQLKHQKWMNRLLWLVLVLVLINQYYSLFYAVKIV